MEENKLVCSNWDEHYEVESKKGNYDEKVAIISLNQMEDRCNLQK